MRELNVNEIKDVNGGMRVIYWVFGNLVWEGLKAGAFSGRQMAPNRYLGEFHG